MGRVAVTLDEAGLRAALDGSLAAWLAPKLARVAAAAAGPAREAVGAAMRARPQYPALLAGELRVAFGLADPQALVGSVVAAVQAAVRADVLPADAGSFGGVRVAAFRADFQDALQAAGASYRSVNHRSGAGTVVPWLAWLLFKGGEVVVADHYFQRLNRPVATSRTGVGVMRRFSSKTKYIDRGPYAVDPRLGGSAAGNWLTEAAAAAGPAVAAALAAAAARELG